MDTIASELGGRGLAARKSNWEIVYEQKGIAMKPRSSRPTRREFLRTAGTAAAAPYLIGSNAFAAADRAAPSERITTALIGSGGRGMQIIAGGDRVVAVCDVDAKHREAAKQKIDAAAGNTECAAYGDFREVLGRDDIDAVVVATPDHWHVAIAIQAIKAGKAVYVEKPLTVCIHEGRALAEVARRYGAIVQVGSQQRSDERFLRACELVRNGRIGELKTVKVDIPTRPGNAEPWAPKPVPGELDYDFWLGPAPWAPYHPDRCHYNFRFVSDYSGGDVTNWGAHQLDMAQWGIGADDSGPLEVEGHGKRNASGLHDVFYDVHVDFTYAGGVKVELRSGEDGVGEVGGNGVSFIGSEGSIYVSRSKLDADPKSVLTSRIGPDEIHLSPNPEGIGGTHMGIWLDCIRSRNPAGINATVEIGHRSATVCHLANLVMELGRKLTWDPVKEEFTGDEEATRLCRRAKRGPWRL
jgi:predicted dehydrogenase